MDVELMVRDPFVPGRVTKNIKSLFASTNAHPSAVTFVYARCLMLDALKHRNDTKNITVTHTLECLRSGGLKKIDGYPSEKIENSIIQQTLDEIGREQKVDYTGWVNYRAEEGCICVKRVTPLFVTVPSDTADIEHYQVGIHLRYWANQTINLVIDWTIHDWFGKTEDSRCSALPSVQSLRVLADHCNFDLNFDC